jgi:hypothetical protein
MIRSPSLHTAFTQKQISRSMNEERINQIIDDLALGRYDSNEKAINDLIEAGMDPTAAKINVQLMETIDIITEKVE